MSKMFTYRIIPLDEHYDDYKILKYLTEKVYYIK